MDNGPCPGTIEHPTRATDAILSQNEAITKIYSSRVVSASNIWSKYPFIVVQRVNIDEKIKKQQI